METKTHEIYEFDFFRLDVAERILLRNDETVNLTPKVFDLLVLLVKHHGHLLEKEELIKELWQDSFVEEANLNVNVSALRRALGEKPNEHKFIETVPRRGYRFVAKVREIKTDDLNVDVPLDTNRASQGETGKNFDAAVSQIKRCPKCQSLYTDETLKFCRKDGEALEIDAQSLNRTTALLPKQNDIGVVQSTLTALPTLKGRNLRLPLLLGVLLVVVTAGIFIWAFTNKSNRQTGISKIRTIAVLPFKPLVNNQSDSALEMGMADALITKLSNLQQITVRPTSSVIKYVDANADPIAAGRELLVEGVLVGSIQRAVNKIRVTVQLLRVSDGATLWAESFDDFFTNIFTVQDSISEKMTSSLALKLSGKEKELLAMRYTENSEAYQLYLQGSFHHDKASPDELKKALPFYLQAIEKDPEYVLPYARLAELYESFANYNIDREENYRKAKESAEKAISLDANSADAQMALGRVKLYIEWDFVSSGEAFRRAIELKPKDSGIHHAYAFYLSAIRRYDEAVREMQTALQLDPVSAYINNDLVRMLLNAHRLDEALAQAKRTVELDSSYVYAYRSLSLAYSAKGLHQEAIEAMEQKVDLGGLKKKSAAAAYIYARAGRRKEAEEILSEHKQNLDEVGVSNFSIAIIYVGLGEKDRAIEWLEKSFQKRESLALLINSQYELEELRSDPRLQDLITRLKL